MTEQTAITGYICTDEERVLIKYVATFGLIVLVLFDCILWVQVFNNKSSLAHWLCAAGWSGFVAYLVVLHFRCRIVRQTQFRVTPGGIIMNIYNPNNAVVLDVHDGIYITLVSFEFAYGKASKRKTFYLYSATPYTSDLENGGGLYALERIIRKGILIVPQDKEVDAWIASELKISNVPRYPAVAFKARKIINENIH